MNDSGITTITLMGIYIGCPQITFLQGILYIEVKVKIP